MNNNFKTPYPFNVFSYIFGTHDCFLNDIETAEQLLDNQEFLADYKKVLDTLDDECRNIVIMYFKDKKSVEIIAKEINTDFETVDAFLAKALRQLRRPDTYKLLKKYI